MENRMKAVSGNLAWIYSIPYRHNGKTIHVDLGSGKMPRNPFEASDIIATDHLEIFSSENSVQFKSQDLTKRLLFSDNSIDSFSAYDVLEHIPRWERLPSDEIDFPFINLMSEIYRCLVPGGIFLAMTPAFPSSAAFQDPTHVNLISRETVNYFAGPTHARFLKYGFDCSFQIIYENWTWAGLPLPENFARVEARIKGKGLKHALHRLMRRNTIIYVSYLWLKHRFFARTEPTHLLWILKKPFIGEDLS
jgi:SAM-dependent methyltransferase